MGDGRAPRKCADLLAGQPGDGVGARESNLVMFLGRLMFISECQVTKTGAKDQDGEVLLEIKV